jgi:hypothetical protein
VQLPDDAEIRARAESDGLVEPGADLPRSIRKSVAASLLAERQPPPKLTPSGEQLLSRFTYETMAGTIRVDVTLTPHERPQDGS